MRAGGLCALCRTDRRPAGAEAHRQGFPFIWLYTHEKMTENRAWYARLGYVEFDRRTEHGFSRVFLRKSLR